MNQTRKRTLVGIAGGAATLIGATAIIVPIIASNAQTSSSADSITRLDAAPAAVESADPYAAATLIGSLTNAIAPDDPTRTNFWRIPVDAPFSTMPAGDQCGPEQVAWLTAHAERGRATGTPVETRILNSADTGASLSIGNIHAEGEFVPNSQVVILQCFGIGGGGSQIINLTLDGSAGVWGPPSGWEEDPQPEGVAAVVNLAPGEVADLTFDIADPTQRFTGKIVGDLLGPDNGAVILVDELDFPAAPMPGYYISFAGAVNGMGCTRPGQTAVPCTVAEAEELLRESARR